MQTHPYFLINTYKKIDSKDKPLFLSRKCSLPSGCGVRSTSTTSSCRLHSTAPGLRGTRTLTTGRGKCSIVAGSKMQVMRHPQKRSNRAWRTFASSPAMPLQPKKIAATQEFADTKEQQKKITTQKKKTSLRWLRLCVVRFHGTSHVFPPRHDSTDISANYFQCYRETLTHPTLETFKS